MLEAHRQANVTFFRAPLLAAISGVVYAFSTRRAEGNDFTLGGDGPAIRDNWARFSSAVGLEAWPIGHLTQVHSNRVHWVRDNEFANASPEGDGAGTSLGGIALGVATADCVPILLASVRGTAVAASHAGWRGTGEAVVRKTVEAMVAEARVVPEDLAAVIGPHIGVCCMEVGEEVVEWFAQPEIFERRPEWHRPHLNLARANRLQLLAEGLRPENIQVSTLCTHCRSDLFHSYRRDGESAGRMFSAIGIRP
jgi:hypothetical protein